MLKNTNMAKAHPGKKSGGKNSAQLPLTSTEGLVHAAADISRDNTREHV